MGTYLAHIAAFALAATHGQAEHRVFTFSPDPSTAFEVVADGGKTFSHAIEVRTTIHIEGFAAVPRELPKVVSTAPVDLGIVSESPATLRISAPKQNGGLVTLSVN